MSLDDKIEETDVPDDKRSSTATRYFYAASAYTLAAMVDSYFTAHGLATKQIKEGNPIIDTFINNLGMEWGLFPVKFAIGVSLISAIYYRYNKDNKNWVSKPDEKSHSLISLFKEDKEKKGFKIEPEYLLYPVLLFTALGGTWWTFYNYFKNAM
ncbi:MAG: DUF5658 family protein [Candidatus Woesearchaeota archaeon]